MAASKWKPINPLMLCWLGRWTAIGLAGLDSVHHTNPFAAHPHGSVILICYSDKEAFGVSPVSAFDVLFLMHGMTTALLAAQGLKGSGTQLVLEAGTTAWQAT